MSAAAELLSVWEACRALPAQAQALAFLGLAAPGLDPASLPVGERDRRLARWRARLFGDALELAGACPACGAAAEARVAPHRLACATPAPSAAVVEVEAAGWRARARLPSAADLAALPPAEEAARQLLSAVLLSAEDTAGRPAEAGALPPALLAALDAELEGADPLALVEFALACPACGAAWTARFDIAACLAAEVEAWAWRTLGEVAALAMAFGWREAEVLALNPWRRAAYLELAGK